MARLIRKHSHVTGRRWPHPEFQVCPLHYPSRRNRLAEFPFAVLSTPRFHKLTVGSLPPLSRECRWPPRLGLRTHQHIFAEAFELLALTAVHQLIFCPLRCERLHA